MKGLIYKIVSDSTDKVYIGSTTKTLHERLRGHKKDYNKYLKGKRYYYMSSFEIIELGDYKIELIEELEFKDKKELLKRESYYIQNIQNTINRVIMMGLNEADMCQVKRKNSNKYYRKHAQEICNKNKIKQECFYCDTLCRKSNITKHNKTKTHIEHVKYYIWD